MKKTFNKTYLTKELYLPHGEFAVSDTIIDTGRWNIEHELIFMDPADNKYYRTNYRIGATEMQDETPWKYDDTVEATEVEKKLVIKEEFVAEDEQVQELDTVLVSILNECKNNSIEVLARDATLDAEPDIIIDMNHVEEIIRNYMGKQPLSQESVKTADVDMEKFQKFCKKLRKKLSNVFDGRHETNLNDLPDIPALDDVLEIYCENNSTALPNYKTLSYNLLGLYRIYLQNKQSQVCKSIEAIVDSIAEDYDTCCSEIEAEE